MKDEYFKKREIEIETEKKEELNLSGEYFKRREIEKEIAKRKELDPSAKVDDLVEQIPPKREKTGWFILLLSFSSLIPVIGVVFGIIPLILGLLFKNWYHRKNILLISLIGITFNIILLIYMYYSSIASAKDKSIQKLNRIVKALDSYSQNHNTLPESLTDLINLEILKKTDYYDSYILNINRGRGKDFNFYYQKIDQTSFYLLSKGKDLKPFTKDDLLPTIKSKNNKLLVKEK